jgi:hypothetical protein
MEVRHPLPCKPALSSLLYWKKERKGNGEWLRKVRDSPQDCQDGIVKGIVWVNQMVAVVTVMCDHPGFSILPLGRLHNHRRNLKRFHKHIETDQIPVNEILEFCKLHIKLTAQLVKDIV